MGAYLSKPVTDRVTETEENEYILSAVSSMQGWRISQEDAHTMIPKFNKDYSLFGVYDGHGGAEVAKYTSKQFPQFFLDRFDFNENIETEKYTTNAQKLFVEFDDHLRQDDINNKISIMKKEDEGGDDPEDLSKLHEEGAMPFGELIKRYNVLKSLFDNSKEEGAEKEVGSKSDQIEDVTDSETHAAKRRHDVKNNMDKKAKIIDKDKSKMEQIENETSMTEELKKEIDEVDQDDNDDDYEEQSNSHVASSNSEGVETSDDENGLVNSGNEEKGLAYNISEKPVYDSGCTAVVTLLSYKDKTVSVFNIGDSRCVLCRNGKARDLSVDHKPDDLIEKNRIERAGGVITEDGRVNGGLNLSRAFGDHTYKVNNDLPLEEQMITSKPDIQTAKLCKDDTFMIIACDGIWNVMTSEECIEFVKERLERTTKMSLTEIVSEIFDHCISPDTFGDGSGCDNMTCMIVLFKEEFLTDKN